MNNPTKIKDMLIKTLGSKIEGEFIVLDKINVTVEENVLDIRGNPGLKTVKIGTTKIMIEIDKFIEFFEDILTNNKIPEGSKSDAMISKKFYNKAFKEIDKGYALYILKWKNEGIIF